MASAGTVTVDFAAETAKFTAELKKVHGSVKNMESGFTSLAKIAKTAMGFLSVGLATNFLKSAAAAADQLGKTADKLGVGTERLTAFRLAADDAGVSLDAMDKLLVDSQRRLGEAASGKGEALTFIKRLGMDVRELQALSPDELFLRYSESINGLKNRSDQFAVAQGLFGKSAQEAFALIEAGRPSIDAAQASVDRYGLSLSRVDIKAIEAANDKIGLLGQISATTGQRIVAGLSPFIDALAQSLLDTAGNTETVQRAAENFGKFAYTAFQIASNAVKAFDLAVTASVLGIANLAREMEAGALKARDILVKMPGLFGQLARAADEANKSLGTGEGFAAAIAEQAEARMNTLLAEIKSFSQIQGEANAILADASARAARAVEEDRRRREQRQSTGIDPNISEPVGAKPEEQGTEFFERLEAEKRFREQIFEEQSKLNLKSIESFMETEQQRMRISAEAEARIAEFKQNGFNAAQSLLTAYGGKFKSIATAILAFEKAKAIASTIINTKEAVMKTLAKHGGTPAGYAAAAGIAVLGAAQVAAIASTVIGGGSNAPSLGTPNNPVFTDSSSSEGEERQIGASSKSVTEIHIHGNMFSGQETVDWMLDKISEASSERDVVFIRPDSRQAMELASPA